MDRIVETFREFFARLSVFRREEPVRDTAAFGRFLANRASFVAQKKLYEYVKQRMGMSYPEHFANDEFIASINVAKWRVYAACLSDLGIYMAAKAAAAGAEDDAALALVRHCHSRAVAERFDAAEMRGDPAGIVAEFESRAALANLAHMAQGENAFQLSPKELVRWAPIAPELKKYDVEIVRNSIRFAWVQVRDDFARLADLDAVLADWRRRA
jgi:hypothetical protein